MTKPSLRTLENNAARNIAVNALTIHQKSDTYIQDCLNEIFNVAKPTPQDRAFATELAFGTMRHKLTIDALINKFSARPIKSIDTDMLHILRVGIYQIFYLDGQQDHAVVYETVQQVKQVIASPGGHKFVNAILRNALRALENAKTCSSYTNHRNVVWKTINQAVLISEKFLPNGKTNIEKFFSITYSHPKWIVDRWLKFYGKAKTHTLCLTNNERPLISIRVNTLKISAEDYHTKLAKMNMPFDQIDTSFILHKSINPVLLPGYEEGLFSVQDITAAQIAEVLAPNKNETILDMCASPGGKTCHIAERMGDKGTIIATDVSQEKLKPITVNAKRLGIKQIKTALINEISEDGKQKFDAILIDAPCSNTGVFARRVEARYNLTPASIKQLVKTQKALLKKAVALLKPNGRILYSTCSIDPNENERLIATFLSDNDQFTLTQSLLTLPKTQHDKETETTTYWQDGGYHALLQS